MDTFFDNFYSFKQFGPFLDTVTVPPSAIEQFRGRLPDQLLSYWEDYGWFGSGEGRFWLVNPYEWSEICNLWLEDTPFENIDSYHIIARSGFGHLFFWGEKTGRSLTVLAPWGYISPSFDDIEFARTQPDRSVQLFLSTQAREFMDLNDNDGNALFDRAKTALGTLRHDTMYGFTPLLAFSGEPLLKDLKVLDAISHMMIVAQSTPKRILGT